MIRQARCTWHGVKLNQPDWSDGLHSVAFGAVIEKEKLAMHVLLNAYWEALDFELLPLSNGRGAWRPRINTGLDSPHDIVDWRNAHAVPSGSFQAEPRSVAVLCTNLEDVIPCAS